MEIELKPNQGLFLIERGDCHARSVNLLACPTASFPSSATHTASVGARIHVVTVSALTGW